jgi:hypothetical protein
VPEEPAPFRCSGPHCPSKVEGVAGTIANGRRTPLSSCFKIPSLSLKNPMPESSAVNLLYPV